MQAFIRFLIEYDLTYADVRTTPFEDDCWERMYRKMHKELPPGPWRFRELKKHCADRPAFELRLSALFEPPPRPDPFVRVLTRAELAKMYPGPVRCVGEDGSVVYARVHFEHPPIVVKGWLKE